MLAGNHCKRNTFLSQRSPSALAHQNVSVKIRELLSISLTSRPVEEGWEAIQQMSKGWC